MNDLIQMKFLHHSHFRWSGQISNLLHQWSLRNRADYKEKLFQTKFPISTLVKMPKARKTLEGNAVKDKDRIDGKSKDCRRSVVLPLPSH